MSCFPLQCTDQSAAQRCENPLFVEAASHMIGRTVLFLCIPYA